jgi:transposase
MVKVPNKEDFEKAYFKGLSFEELAGKYFVSMSTIYTWIKKFDLNRNKSKMIESKLKKLFYEGLDSKELATIFKSNHSTIKTYIEGYGLAYIVKVERTKNNVPRKSYVFRGTR